MHFSPIIYFFCCLFLILGCQGSPEYRDVDSHRQVKVEHRAIQVQNTDSTIKIAIASIVSARESFSSYQMLASYIGQTIHRPAVVIHTKEYRDAFNLISQGRADIAFVCSGLYVIGQRSKVFRLLTVPVVKGKSVYQAYIIVPANSSSNTMSDLVGKRFVMTDKLSLTGCFYPLFRSKNGLETWKDVIFSGNHTISIDLVNRGVVDGASVDGLVYDDLERRFPARVKNTRVIEKSEPFGIPPVVSSSKIAPELERVLQDIFTGMHNSIEGKKVLDSLGFDRFEKPNENFYRSIEKIVPETILQ